MKKELNIAWRVVLASSLAACGGSVKPRTSTETMGPRPAETAPLPTSLANPIEIPTAVATMNATERAVEKTVLDRNLTDATLLGKVSLLGMGGEITGFGEPKITEGLTADQIEAARMMLGTRNGGTLYAAEGGKAVIQRLTGVQNGVNYTALPDSQVPFRVTVTMLPNTFTQRDGQYVLEQNESRPGQAEYIRTNDQTEQVVTTSFLVEPGFLPTGAALWWDMSTLTLRPVMWDGNGNPRLMEDMQVEVKPVPIPTETPTTTPTPTVTPIPTETPAPTETPVPVELPDRSEAINMGMMVETYHHFSGVKEFSGEIFGVFIETIIPLLSHTDGVLVDGQSFSDPVTEMVFGYKINSKAVKFRVLGVQCQVTYTTQSPITVWGIVSKGSNQYSKNLNDLKNGDIYSPTFWGLEDAANTLDLSKQTLACRTVVGGLEQDSTIPDKMRKFFTTGNPSGFSIDQNGVVDLRHKVTLLMAHLN